MKTLADFGTVWEGDRGGLGIAVGRRSGPRVADGGGGDGYKTEETDFRRAPWPRDRGDLIRPAQAADSISNKLQPVEDQTAGDTGDRPTR